MKLYRTVISIVFFALAVYVFVLNLVCTCFTSADRFELNYYSGDIVIINVAVLALAFAGVMFAGREKVAGFLRRHFIPLKAAVLILTGAAGMVLVFSCGLKAGVDQLYVQQAVDGMRRGVYDSFLPAMYMDIYPNQYGYALISYLLSFVFGTYCYTAIRIINVLFLVLLYNELSLIGKQTGLGRAGQIAVLFAGMMFLPTTLYVLFIYGNIAGLALAVLSVRLMISHYQKDKTVYAILSVAAMFLSCLIKSNHMIFGVGLIIYCLFKSLSIKKYIRLISVPLLIAAIWLSSFVPLTVMRNMTGLPLNGGVSYMSYLAMGVQENSPNYAGGFNGFNEDTYRQTGGDKKIHGEFSSEVYGQIMGEMASDPAYFLNFFARKQLHQWADPLYKSYWSVQSVAQDGTALWFNSFIDPRAGYPVAVFYSFTQLITWTGCILYIWIRKRESGSEEALILPMIFIGGFIFHTFWEAKSQYCFPYYVILFPLCIMGWISFSRWYQGKEHSGIRESLKKLSGSTISWSFRFTLAACAAALLLPEVVGIASLRTQFAQDREMYQEYLSEGFRQAHNPLDDGSYTITNGDAAIDCYIINQGDKTLIKDKDTDRYLTAAITAEGEGTLEFRDRTNGPDQLFKLYMTDEKKLIIVYNDEYVYGSGNGVYKVFMVPYGTLDWSGPNEGMTWDFSRAD